VFRSVPRATAVTPEPRDAVERAARELLRVLSGLPSPPTLRVADSEGRVACLVLVWDASRPLPTAGAERRRRAKGGRTGCKADIVEVLQTAGRALTRKEVVKVLRAAGKDHGPSTVAKALADLTATGELVNPKDKRGYRLPGWVRRETTPSLFD
jgi:hypothetical protein